MTLSLLRLYSFMVSGPIWLMQPIPYFGEKISGHWICEPKIDGWRMQILRFCDGRVECWGRRLERKPNWSEKLSKLVTLTEKVVPRGTLLDCELHSTGGRRFIPSLFAKKPKVKPIVYVFDVIFFENEDVSALSLNRRKDILHKLKFKKPFYPIFGKRLTTIKKHYAEEVRKGYEGILIKKLDSPYLVGREAPIATHCWRKIK